MDRKTAQKYRSSGKLPSQSKPERDWRTREDPFATVWPEVEEILIGVPELEAKFLFENLLLKKYADQFQQSHLRTFQRRVRQWRARRGPPKEIFFPQLHRPGEAMQTDFTSGGGLSITIDGEAFPHLLCHPVLPFSNWEWVTICQSESMAALKRGVQAATQRLGAVTEWHQTDNSTAATHDLGGGKRDFNAEYLEFMTHLGMRPRTIKVGEKHQNGDVESSHRVFKRRVEQHLLLRGSRDFPSVNVYEDWLQDIAHEANRGREKKLQEELPLMKSAPHTFFPEYMETVGKVTSWSTIKIQGNIYSVPSRLINEKVRVRIFDDRVEIYHGSSLELTVPRLVGKRNSAINYRHVIRSLARKPGAFARYRFREQMFPSLVFRKTYDRLREHFEERRADVCYLQILHLAASSSEEDVAAALSLLLEHEAVTPDVTTVKQLLSPTDLHSPALAEVVVDLGAYDQLLSLGGH